jgi:hypothetical protein
MAPLAKAPFATIQKGGSISLNASAIAAIGSPKAVELLYDKTNDWIGLRAAEVTSEHAYPVRPASKSGTSWLIAPIAFMDFYGVNTDVARRYAPDVFENTLIIKLKGPSTEIISNRERGRHSASDKSKEGNGGLF